MYQAGQDRQVFLQCFLPQDKLPQLDGNDEEEDFSVEWINRNPASGLWTCRCCTYANTFKT